jgi:hypothetical protein
MGGEIGYTWKWRIYEYRKMAERSVPLITAIKQYENKYRKPPATLENLVPEYLQKVPKTGMRRYPNYEYIVGADAIMNFDGNPWVLYVKCESTTGFLYLPKKNYSAEGWVGKLERVEGWAFARIPEYKYLIFSSGVIQPKPHK